jgi:hypothetical protein
MELDMITLRDFMEIVDYRITEGSDFLWQCFGSKAYRLDSWESDRDSHTVSVVFDPNTQTVYQMEAHDYPGEKSFRWTHPDYREAHTAEARERDVNVQQAWDHVNFVDIESAEHLLRISRAIVQGQPYDQQVSVPIDLTDEEWYQLMRQAHEHDVTLNQWVQQLLERAILDAKSKVDQ